jgi:hypothetical protein
MQNRLTNLTGADPFSASVGRLNLTRKESLPGPGSGNKFFRYEFISAAIEGKNKILVF